MRMLLVLSILPLLGALLSALSAFVLLKAARGVAQPGVIKPYVVTATLLFVLFASCVGIAVAQPGIHKGDSTLAVSTAATVAKPVMRAVR